MSLHLVEISQASRRAPTQRLGSTEPAGICPKTQGAGQHNLVAAPSKVPKTQTGRKYLVIHTGKIAFESDFPLLQGHRRSLLRLEYTYKPPMADYVHRHARLGAWVLINENWYNFYICGRTSDACRADLAIVLLRCAPRKSTITARAAFPTSLPRSVPSSLARRCRDTGCWRPSIMSTVPDVAGARPSRRINECPPPIPWCAIGKMVTTRSVDGLGSRR